MAVVRIGIGLVVSALGGGKQDARFGIKNLVAHIDFWVAVAVEVGETDTYGEVIVARVVALVGYPDRIAWVGCHDVVSDIHLRHFPAVPSIGPSGKEYGNCMDSVDFFTERRDASKKSAFRRNRCLTHFLKNYIIEPGNL